MKSCHHKFSKAKVVKENTGIYGMISIRYERICLKCKKVKEIRFKINAPRGWPDDITFEIEL
jgi:hypothetical protein